MLASALALAWFLAPHTLHPAYHHFRLVSEPSAPATALLDPSGALPVCLADTPANTLPPCARRCSTSSGA